MATQASAITFLSMPGQAYEDGMRFVQFYFGLPIAMVVLSVAFVPLFYRLRVLTAYEYLEARFDLKTRQLAAFLFLLQRGLVGGHHDLRAGDHPVDGARLAAEPDLRRDRRGWSSSTRSSGGTRAVSQTQKQQMVVMLGGHGGGVRRHRPRGCRPTCRSATRVDVAGALGKMNVVDLRPTSAAATRFWSGLTGGCFLALSYFGTDQSQVQRYLSGRSVTESRLGLLFNGLFKVPMQFLILFVGVMVFVFYQFNPPPLFFNEPALRRVAATAARAPSCRRSRRGIGRRSSDKRAEVQRLRGGAGRGRPATRSRPPKRGVRTAAADATRVRNEARALIAASGAARRRERRRLRVPVVRDGEPAARPGRAPAGGDPVRGDVVDRQRADRAGRMHGRRLLPAQLPPVGAGRALRPRREDRDRRLGRPRRPVRRLRVAPRQPDPGREHPRLALLRNDPGDLPGRVLRAAAARDAGLRRGDPVGGWSSSSSGSRRTSGSSGST